uniref:Uncharacterized protein n=1 Tax=Aegilops tauschii subsp. strangulata TaxID=200361 RepID=A0A453RVU0_AEGTS
MLLFIWTDEYYVWSIFRSREYIVVYINIAACWYLHFSARLCSYLSFYLLLVRPGTLLQIHWLRRQHGSLKRRMGCMWLWSIQGLFWAR